MTAPTVATTGHLPVEIRDAISELFLQGRRVSEVIAQGLNRRNGWRRADVIDLVSARGWKLDSDGRIPRHYRTSAVVPIGTVPGAPTPAPGTPASWPEKGTVTVDRTGPAAADLTATLIADGKAHSVPRVRKLADKAETTLAELRRALKHEEGREGLRRRLAELDAERDRLRAQLAGPGRRRAAKEASVPTPRAATGDGGDIEHGTWGGFLKEKRRGLEHCQPCLDAKDRQMDSLHGPRRAAAAEKSA